MSTVFLNRLVDSGSISEIVAQLRSLFQVGLQYVLRVSEYIFKESVLSNLYGRNCRLCAEKAGGTGTLRARRP